MTRTRILCFAFCIAFGVNAFAGTVEFDFESGDLAAEGWKIVEGENERPIGDRDTEFRNPQKPYAKKGKHYLTTLESMRKDQPTDEVRCVLESPVFVIEGAEATLLVGGGKRPKTYVGLCPLQDDGSVGEPLRIARGNNSQGLDPVHWKTDDLKNKAFVLRAVDLEAGSWAHIRLDGFSVEGRIDPDKTRLRDDYIKNVIERKRAAEEARRLAAVKNPLLLAQPILYVTRSQYRRDHHNTATLFQTGEINTSSFSGGGSLRVWNPADNSVRILLDLPSGVVRDPCLSFDAKKTLLSIRRDIKDDYHVYELDLEHFLENPQEKPLKINPDYDASRGPLRQLTSLKGISDIDPLYLPGGEIVFSSTREPKYCMCNRHIMCNLYKMNGDGSNIQQIGKSTLFEGHSSLLPDGRILYDRWEYVDRNFGDAQGVWVTTTEGFNHAIFWGNNTASPGGVIDARVLPGSSSEFIATFSSCHDRPWGAIALVDRRLGIDGKQSVLQTWPDSAINLVDVGDYDTFTKVRPKFEDPFPLSTEWFLASGMTGKNENTGIWLLGRDGTMVLVHEDADVPGCFDPTPILATAPPPANTQRADLSQTTGTFYVTNVYVGHGMEKVAKGAVKYLRVVESPEKRTWSSVSWHNGSGDQAPGMSWKDFNNKRILGTIPVEDDGSASFEAPADVFLYVQILDEQGRMIQTMRSGMIVRPGETNGCYGCHEDRLQTLPMPHMPKALAKSPHRLDGWHGSPRLFSYVKEVQEPVFDKYCTECHDYGKVESNPKMPNLAGDLNTIFNTSYVQLHRRGLVRAVGAGPHVKLDPYTWGSTQSRLAKIVAEGHDNPETDQRRKELGLYFDRATQPELVDRVISWIDINAPYYGTYLTPFPNNRYGRCPLPNDKMQRLTALTGMDGKSGTKDKRELDWAISFTRPELSPCLSRWDTDEKRRSPEYAEALAIIREGRDILERQPRGEDPSAVPAPPRDAEQQRKYDRLRDHELRMRQAIIDGKKMYDGD